MKFFKKLIIFILWVILVAIIILATIIGAKYVQFKNHYTEKEIEKVINEIQAQPLYAKLDEVGKNYKDLVIAAEDHRYYEHGPFDYIAIGRAMVKNIKNKKFLEGGSTITQQFAKNAYFNQSVNLNRKIYEAFMAMALEKKYSKAEIFELYINTSYFGSGYYSIKEASLGYLGKLPNNLTDNEAAFLAGVPNAPSVYDPRVSEEKAEQRKRQVLVKAVDNKVMTQEKADQIAKEKIVVIKHSEGLKHIKDEIKKNKKNNVDKGSTKEQKEKDKDKVSSNNK